MGHSASGGQKQAAPQLVVMAAGLGSRYGGFKQVEPVGPSGEILVDYAVFDAIRAGFGRVVFVLRRDIEDEFRERVGRNIETRIDTVYICQESDLYPLPDGELVHITPPVGREKPWGTTQAVLSAALAIDAPFAVINADDYYGPASFHTLADFLSADSAEYCMIGFPLLNTLSEHGHVARGICEVGADGLLAAIVERLRVGHFPPGLGYLEGDDTWRPLPRDATVSMNMWGFQPAFFDSLAAAFAVFLSERSRELRSECHLPGVVGDLLSQGSVRIRVLPTPEQWYGVTYREDRATLQRALAEFVASGRYPARLWG